MNNVKTIDARGLGCPQPVILAKKALDQDHQIVVLVDDEIALENIKRMGTNAGCDIRTNRQADGNYEIYLAKAKGTIDITDPDALAACGGETRQKGPFLVVFSEDRMGRGNEELGHVLIRMFIHTLCQQDMKPDAMIFYNTGVKLTVKDSEVLDDLKTLAGAGVDTLVCGTCTNYFNITKDVAVGTISNMYDIAGLMSRAERLVSP